MKYVTFPGPFELESGESLPELKIAYHSWGELQSKKVVWVFHALTANSDVSEWWPGLFGAGKLLDPDKYFIICANMLGSCYGSSCPDALPTGTEFPLITIRDMVKAHKMLATHLGIEQIHLGLGGSMGGQQLLEWSVQEPERFEFIVPLATNAKHSPWGIAFNEAQRMAIEAGRPAGKDGARMGLEAARAMALLSYRHYQAYEKTQSEAEDTKLSDFKASSYQRYQGTKLSSRFDVDSYYTLSKAMDSHNIGRDRNGIANALSRIEAKALVIGIDSDILFPMDEQIELALHLKNARLYVIESTFGHDGFLVELDTIGETVKAFLEGRMDQTTFFADRMGERLGKLALPGSESF